jgi:outer membrane receptor protein involved in Fe transport
VKLNYAEGFRPPSFQATNTNPNVSSGITLSGNPDLDVERSRAAQVELNTVFIEDTSLVDRWFARVDYSFTILEDIILSNPQGTFFNSGTRHIHSVEVLSRLQFVGNHELSLAYYFVEAEDDASGPIRNIANNIINASGRLQIISDILSINVDLTWIGPMEDANRRVPESEQSGELVTVYPTDVFWERLDPVALIRAGVRAENIADLFMVEVFGYNLLDQTYLTPDMFPDDRVAIRPYINPRWSFFATVGAEF